jgi:PA14 domain
MDFIGGNGNGLKAQIFDRTGASYGLQAQQINTPSAGYGLQPSSKNTSALGRIDPILDFNGNDTPVASAPTNRVAAMQLGRVSSTQIGTSVLTSKANQGIAAWGNGQLLSNTQQNNKTNIAQSGQNNLRGNAFGRGGNTVAPLYGAAPLIAQPVIPQPSSAGAKAPLAPASQRSGSANAAGDRLTGSFFGSTNPSSVALTRKGVAPTSAPVIAPAPVFVPAPAPAITPAPVIVPTPVVVPTPTPAPAPVVTPVPTPVGVITATPDPIIPPDPAPILTPAPVPVIGTGNGLTGKYFNSTTLDASTLALTRTDANVNFNWNTGTPNQKVLSDHFSAEWIGQVLAPETGTYTFTTTSDDGVRVWVNGQKLIDAWNDHASQQDSGTITLQAGQKYDIKVDYYERTGGAVMQLNWSTPHMAQQPIPQAYLYSSVLAPTPDPIVTATPTSSSSSALSPAFDDSILPNEGIPSGVPSYLPWAHGPMKGYGKDIPSGWNAFTAWGQIYVQSGWNPPSDSNTRVQIRALDAWYLSKSTHQWVLLQHADTVSGAAYVEDFANDASKPADTKDESKNGGGISVTAGNGYNYHFWTDRAVIADPSDIAAIYTKFESRLVLNDPNGPDDRDSSKYLASDGADYWRSLTSGWASDWSNNGSVGHGRFKFVTNDWQIFSLETLTPEQMSQNPPPING